MLETLIKFKLSAAFVCAIEMSKLGKNQTSTLANIMDVVIVNKFALGKNFSPKASSINCEAIAPKPKNAGKTKIEVRPNIL
jgi:hypothetical protein